MLEPTFGGINLEDIKAPECFIIEEVCKHFLAGLLLQDRELQHQECKQVTVHLEYRMVLLI